MKTKQMTLCRVKLKWKREPVKNSKGEEIFGPIAEYEGFYVVETVIGEHPFMKQRRKAARMALEEVVGPPEYQETVRAEVVSTEILGLVAVEEDGSPYPFLFPLFPRLDSRKFDCPVPDCDGKMVADPENLIAFVCQKCKAKSTSALIEQGVYME